MTGEAFLGVNLMSPPPTFSANTPSGTSRSRQTVRTETTEIFFIFVSSPQKDGFNRHNLAYYSNMARNLPEVFFRSVRHVLAGGKSVIICASYVFLAQKTVRE